MLRITGIKLSIDQGQQEVEQQVIKKLKIRKEDLLDYRIYKQSIDARKQDQLYFVYTVDAKVNQEEKVLKRCRTKEITIAPDMTYHYVERGSQSMTYPPVVVGTGPAGLFAALILAEMGYKPILLERGKKIEERLKDVQSFWNTGSFSTESNVQFGEGGAGTFSDGKLTTQIRDTRCRKVLEELIEAKAPEDIIYKNKPHVGTDVLQVAVKNIRNKIKALGGKVYFESKVTNLILEKGKLSGIEINGKEILRTEVAVIAVGHSARDTFEMLYNQGLAIQPKPFSLGVRIEHPQHLIDKRQYGRFAGHPKLGAADYKLVHHCEKGRSVYTFCMCPGGVVVAAASEEGGLVTNGMSEYARDQENANSALLVGINPEDFEISHPLAGMYFQRRWEKAAFKAGGSNYYAPVQLVKDFLEDRPSKNTGSVKPSYKPGVTPTDLKKCLPKYVVEALKEGLIALDRKLKGFALEDAVMTGVETRTSSPIRIQRNQQFESNIQGIYPAGEGAGYAGGIVSAAVDGIKVAEAIAKVYRPNI